MPMMAVKFVGPAPEVAWPELAQVEREGRLVALVGEGHPISVAVLQGGMTSGKPSLAIRVDLPDNKVLVVETSALAFVTAARAISARYPNLTD